MVAKVAEARDIGEVGRCPCYMFKDGRRFSVLLKQQCTSFHGEEGSSTVELMENSVTYTSNLPSFPLS